MKVNASLETRHSEKSGNDYQVIVVKLTPTYEKLVFLDKAEIELLKTTHSPLPDVPFFSDEEVSSLKD